MSTKQRQLENLNALCVVMKGLHMGKEKPAVAMKSLGIAGLELEKWSGMEAVIYQIQLCEKKEHKQTVAYSTNETALTQVCFTCKSVRTNGNY